MAKRIECDALKCGGQPTLVGRRITVGEVVCGVLEYCPSRPDKYLGDLSISNEEAKAAIMYCREQRCETDQPLSRCWGCSKRFSQDETTFEDFVGKDVSESNGMTFIGNNVYLGDVAELYQTWIGRDIWKLTDEILALDWFRELDWPTESG